MLVTAFTILAVVVMLGSVLAVLRLRMNGAAPPPPWPLALLHGLLAIGGLCCLALALRGPPRGLDQGAGSFGTIAIALIMLAALVGAGLFIAHVRKRRIAGIVIGIHAALAVSGFAILAAYVFAG
jgi:hypothetical protein